MNLIRYIFFSIFILSLTPVATAQPTTDEQLAAHYYQNGEFEKAVMYYEKLFEKNSSRFYYDKYLSSLLELERYKDAEKMVKKQLKRFPYEIAYHVDLGDIYERQEEPKKAEKEYQEAIKELRADYKQVIQLGNAFKGINKIDYALEAYEKGQRLLKGTYPFNVYIADLHGIKGEDEKMIQSYLDLLDINMGYLQSVQNSLNRVIDFEQDSPRLELLKTELLRRTQRDPNKTIYADMLIWLFEQKGDFESAFIQVKALDKREDRKGERVMNFARVAASNNLYDLSGRAYDYVIDLGKNSFYYDQARMEKMNVLYKKVTTGFDYTQEELQLLEQQYEQVLSDLGKRAATIDLIRELAHLQAFYLHNTEKAANILEEALALPRLAQQVQAELKLDLGDVLLLKGDIWDASLYYSQVDKAFKHDILGHEAKFRNAKISYYVGEFDWAQSQLNVLKASTSKLIANDAMELSLLITDNLALDTTATTMLLFAKADLLAFQNKFDDALATLDSIKQINTFHSINDEALFLRYRIAKKRRDFEKAAIYLMEIIKDYSEDILADNALFELAELHHFQFNDLEKAKDYYQQLLLNYPGSLFTVEARKRFRQLRGENLE